MSAVQRAMPDDAVVRYETRGSAAWITLNRPEARNALSAELVAGLDDALTQAAYDGAVRSVVFAGNGPMFCAGADLKMVLERMDKNGRLTDFLASVGRLCDRISRLPKPVIAAVHGSVIAGGFELVLACDLVVAAENATFADGHARYGLFPAAGGATRLPRKIGLNRAKQLLFTAQSWNAQRMRECGLVNEIVPESELVEAVDALTEQFAKRSPDGLAGMKRILEAGLDVPLDEALGLELQACERYIATSPDFTEGLRAFAQRREPRFGGE